MRPVVMVGTISGPRDGVDWPARGQAIVLPADEADALVGNGMARELAEGEEPVFPAAPGELETAEDTAPVATTEAPAAKPGKGK